VTLLPIDALIPEIRQRTAEQKALVLVAEPGAGKTTRVPPALLGDAGEVWVLEPRRIAARMAARRVAEEMGERLGETVGLHVRFEEQASKRTRLRFMTEGILTRRILSDPTLRDVATVILDELHERHLEGDLALALLARLRRTTRPDLRIVCMSATLEAGKVARFLGASVLEAPGRTFPVAVEYQPGSRPLEERVRDALSQVGPGDALVFLPGAGEIRRAIDACSSLPRALFPLHGSLPPEEQDRALRPASRPKAIFATNVAETSLTVEGVTTVIDSGLARIPGHSAWSGLPLLEVEPISQASARQRAGRAGRLGPGRCIRLYSKEDLESREAFTSPEIARLDLVQLALQLRAAGVASLEWLEPPPGHALETAEKLLRRLGALGRDGELTKTGERMLRFPVHPRLGRVLADAEGRGTAREACAFAASLGERESQRDRVREQLERLVRDGAATGDPLARSILAGYPDRVAQRRGPREVLLADGTTAEAHAVASPFLVAVEAQERRGSRPIVREAVPIEAEWILDAFTDEVRETVEVTWDARAERVQVSSRILYGAIVLEESARGRAPEGEVERILLHHALVKGPGAFADPEALDALAARAAFARTIDPTIPELGEARARELLGELVTGRRSFAELRDADLLAALRAGLTHEQRTALERLAPAEVVLAGGRRTRIHYAAGQPPHVASRLQDFFGMREGPRVGGGKVPLVLHLLAPSQRPVQITSDLAGFWVNHYPRIRRELSRRYPKHAWPEDPLSAKLPPPRRP